MKTIYQLQLHENLDISVGEYPRYWAVTRVSSGWIYQCILGGSPVFVPDTRIEHKTGPK